MHVSIIEDEVLLGEKIRNKLTNQWYIVSIFTSYTHFMEQGSSTSHLYIIDIWLWDGNGFDIINWLRKKENSSAPIMITSWYGDTDRIVYGLKIGADDYMVKPCIPDEFLARVDALARRHITNVENPETLKAFTYKDITFTPLTQEVIQWWNKIFLSKKEMIIFELLITNQKIMVSRETMIERAWGAYNSTSISDTIVNTALSRMRKKFWNTLTIKSIYNFGYILQ